MPIFARRPPERAPLEDVDVVLADLDGVVYAGAGALPYAVESLNRAARGATARLHHEQRLADGCLGGGASERARARDRSPTRS